MEKKRDKKEAEKEKKKDRHIIRPVVEEEWEFVRVVGEGKNKRSIHKCKLCGEEKRSNNRRVHACPQKL